MYRISVPFLQCDLDRQQNWDMECSLRDTEPGLLRKGSAETKTFIPT